jgi:hypothetical protein
VVFGGSGEWRLEHGSSTQGYDVLKICIVACLPFDFKVGYLGFHPRSGCSFSISSIYTEQYNTTTTKKYRRVLLTRSIKSRCGLSRGRGSPVQCESPVDGVHVMDALSHSIKYHPRRCYKFVHKLTDGCFWSLYYCIVFDRYGNGSCTKDHKYHIRFKV